MEVERDGDARMSETFAELQFLFQKLVQVKQVFSAKTVLFSLHCVSRLMEFVSSSSFSEDKAASPLVSKEKEKLVPIFREKEKDNDLPASIWQKSRHWDARKASSFVVAIFAAYF